MKSSILTSPTSALGMGVAMINGALRNGDHVQKPHQPRPLRGRIVFLAATLIAPAMAHAASTDLRTATEQGNSILMYVSGSFAAIGIVTAGVAMMAGRSSIAKWAFVGAMVCGLAFPIVRAIWSSAGMEAADVGAFGP